MDILVPKDEADIRNLLQLGLTGEGYSVFPAADGFEALALLQKEDMKKFMRTLDRKSGTTHWAG